MLGLSDARRFRRLVAGFCLIAAPVVLLVGALVHPTSKDDAAAHIAIVSDNADRYYAAHAILLAGLALFLPAVLGLNTGAASTVITYELMPTKEEGEDGLPAMGVPARRGVRQGS
jgi:hypothetical protein